jgi:hypothetical protein
MVAGIRIIAILCGVMHDIGRARFVLPPSMLGEMIHLPTANFLFDIYEGQIIFIPIDRRAAISGNRPCSFVRQAVAHYPTEHDMCRYRHQTHRTKG